MTASIYHADVKAYLKIVVLALIAALIIAAIGDPDAHVGVTQSDNFMKARYVSLLTDG